MLLDLSNSVDLKKAKAYLNKLHSEGAKIEIVKKNPKSISQNRYLHVCISLFGSHFGYTLQEAKTLLKRSCEFMTYEKNGKRFLKEVSKLNEKETSDFIEWIRNYAGKEGCYIPTSEEYLEAFMQYDREIQAAKVYQ